MQNKINTHPSIVHCRDVKEICQPLERLAGIDHFAHINVDKKGNFTALGKNPEFVKHYFDSKYYNYDIHLTKLKTETDHILLDSVIHHGETAQIYEDCQAFKLYHIYTILHKNNDAVDAYHFATSIQENNLNHKYLNLTGFLQQFISHFKNQVAESAHLKAAYNHKYSIDNNVATYQANDFDLNDDRIEYFLQETNTKRFYLLDKGNNYLTKREVQCLLWFHHGKTAHEVADMLNITERTVRAHINSIKSKLNCETMLQLGGKIMNFNLDKLFHYYEKCSNPSLS